MTREALTNFCLSPQQQRLWSLMAAGESQAYRARCEMIIEGPLDTDLLRCSIEQVVERHSILRTSFSVSAADSYPLQIINPGASPSIAFHDLSDMDAAEQGKRLAAIFDEPGRLPFAPGRASMLACSIVSLSPSRHGLALSLPALCADRVSLLNLAREIGRCYEAALAGRRKPDPLVQYVEMSEWQNELLEADDTKAGRDYWAKLNLNGDGKRRLPFELRDLSPSAFQLRHVEVTLAPELVEKINEVARDCETTLPDFLLAGWHVLVSRLSHRRELVVGVCHDCRRYEELQQCQGLFAKHIPVRCRFDSEASFIEILRRVGDAAREAREWQEHFSWNHLRGIDAEYLPLGFDFYEAPDSWSVAGLEFSILRQEACFDRFRLQLCCIAHRGSMTARYNYDPSYFTASDVERLAMYFITIIESAVTDPTVAAGDLEVLTEAERNRLLFKLNNTKADYPEGVCIHEMFEQQVERTPHSTALVFDGASLSFLQLNSCANRLAHLLISLGVSPDLPVALLLPRSIDLFVALLAVLKAGAAYLPLDHDSPSHRLSSMLTRSSARLVLTSSSLAHLVQRDDLNVISLDSITHQLDSLPDHNPNLDVCSANLAYIIFTSGTTGGPKGVAIEHRNLVNYVKAVEPLTGLGQGARYALLTTVAADLGNTLIYISLVTGGELHILSREVATDSKLLADYVEGQKIQSYKIVPTHLRAVLEAERGRVLPEKRLVIGGEASSWEMIERIREYGKCEVINHYGPTETTVGAVATSLSGREATGGRANVMLGRGLANVEVYVLDERMNVMPEGIEGELYIGGAGVGRGYVGEGGETAERFVPDPFSKEEGRRMYRSGDRCVIGEGGEIEYLGRVDGQIKIRGYRIEIGEIEEVMLREEGVRQSAVKVEEEGGIKRVVGYVVVGEGEKEGVKERIKERMRRELPGYMVAWEIEVIGEMPVTSNGKIDRGRLERKKEERREGEGRLEETEKEKKLKEIWKEVMGREEIGVEENYFEMGGDSIQSIQIVARANEAGMRMSARQIFEEQTIRGLAKVIGGGGEGEGGGEEAEQGEVRGEVELTPIQHWFFEQDLTDAHYWNQSLLLEARIPISPVLLARAVESILAHHDALRMRYERAESGWRQHGAGLTDSIPFMAVDLSELPSGQRTGVLESIAAEVQASLNLSEGPMIRVLSFHLGEGESSRVLIVIHHLTVDAVSWRVILEDLQSAYLQLERGERPIFPRKTTSFRSWSHRLLEHANSDEVIKELDYWMSEPRSKVAPLPVDFEGGLNILADTDIVSVALNEDETRALLEEVPVAYNTQINDALLAALALAFKGWTGQAITLVDLEGHGREEIFQDLDLSRTVGWFTARFPVLLDLRAASTPAEALVTVKEMLRKTPKRGIGYGLLRYLKGDEAIARKLREMPQPEISFNYFGQLDQILTPSSPFGPALESAGSPRSPRGKRRHLLVINGQVAGSVMQFGWRYATDVHRRETIDALAKAYIDALRSLIEHCLSPQAGGYTASDFADFGWSQSELDNIIATIGRSV